MQNLETGVLYIGTKKMEETAEHISRLSIRYSLKGEQYYRVGSNDHVIDPHKYMIVNQGQRYRTAFDSAEDHEMILVAFKPGFAEAVLHDMITPDDQLLDQPFVEQRHVGLQLLDRIAVGIDGDEDRLNLLARGPHLLDGLGHDAELGRAGVRAECVAEIDQAIGAVIGLIGDRGAGLVGQRERPADIDARRRARRRSVLRDPPDRHARDRDDRDHGDHQDQG